MEKNQNKKGLLSEFLTNMEKIPNQITDSLIKFSDDEDEKNVINTYSSALNNQFKELSNYIEEQRQKTTKQAQLDTEQYLKIASPNLMINNMKLSLPSIGSIVGKLGIDGIVKEIKKIVKEILNIFGIKLPKWIDGLLLLIDEIIGILFGGGSPKLRVAFSQIEQAYLGELTQLARLQKATNNLSNDEDDMDDF
ncbi:hypothetical protein JL193_05515 [Polaribacter batillariae]|uniref:Uncharacterized protein n=1 Tax=Polaribacter batillariae TaxID=2808900 RepID=A0ABX7SX05_9FLAO|nr:hypothetical protein [Polaribacter batillariae]QTD38726.1 hypothetical protein JL193_05515 [Polaribacter batillariae]